MVDGAKTEISNTVNSVKNNRIIRVLSEFKVVLSGLYRVFKQVTSYFDLKTETCWTTARGEGAAPVKSCEGLGNPFYFYVDFVFVLAGSEASALFLYGLLLSGSIFGGILTVSAFFFNHGEATRVQWTPALRESFGYPLFLWQMLLVSYILKYRKKGKMWFVGLSLLICCFLASWQFASFALSTQVACIFFIYCFDYLEADLMKRISLASLTGFFAAFLLLFGNQMLLSSLFLSSLLATQVVLHTEPLFKRLSERFAILCFKILLFATMTVAIKTAIGFVFGIRDDAHIFDILKSKFTNFSTFHTRMYTCAAEFDFLDHKAVRNLLESLIIPTAAISVLVAFVLFLSIEWRRLKGRDVGEDDFSECWYNVLQLGCFTLMAVLIMRLKLFFTPHLCIVVSLLANQKLLRAVTGFNVKKRYIDALCVLLLAAMAVKGHKNLQDQWKISGEYSNFPLERLFYWIMANTKPDDVFVGSMPLMANLKLSTGRPIVIHPHYEDAELRDRVMKAYSVFSRKPLDEIYRILKDDLRVDYLIFESVWCKLDARTGCSMPELFDLHDLNYVNNTPACNLFVSKKTGPFKLVYETDIYRVFKIN